MAIERLVVDGGYLVESVLPTNPSWQTDALYLINASAIGDIELHCPQLMLFEIAAVCSRSVRSKKLKQSAAMRLFELPIATRDSGMVTAARALKIPLWKPPNHPQPA